MQRVVLQGFQLGHSLRRLFWLIGTSRGVRRARRDRMQLFCAGKVVTTHIHKWCQSTFWQNWVKYITGIYGKMWFWKWRIKLSWLIWIKFKICLILWTPLLLVLSAVRFKQWHSKVVLQWINEIEGEKQQAKSNMSGASHYEIARLYNLHHLWLSRPGLKGNTVAYIWC